MLSNDKNVESIATLVETLKDYVVLQKDYLKYDVVEKLVRLSAALLLAFFIFGLVFAVVFYLSFSLPPRVLQVASLSSAASISCCCLLYTTSESHGLSNHS